VLPTVFRSSHAGIWAASSFFNHSCAPAVEKTREGRGWRFNLCRDVTAGEELCISYLGEGELREWTYNLRQQQLKKSWGFNCACPRCEL
jgi:SET domain-containing protein